MAVKSGHCVVPIAWKPAVTECRYVVTLVTRDAPVHWIVQFGITATASPSTNAQVRIDIGVCAAVLQNFVCPVELD